MTVFAAPEHHKFDHKNGCMYCGEGPVETTNPTPPLEYEVVVLRDDQIEVIAKAVVDELIRRGMTE